MPAAIDNGRKLHAGVAAANIKRAYTLRSVNLVGGDRQQVDIVLLHVHGNLADRLHAIDREDNAVFLGNLADFLDRIDDADLIVGVHDGDQNRLRRDRLADVLGIDAAIPLHRQIGHLIAVLFQPLARVQHRFVFNRLSDDVVALFAVHLGNALDHQVVGFRCAAGKDDFFRRSADQRGNLRARDFDGLFASPAKRVIAARRVTKPFGEIRQHGVQYARIDRRSRMIIHVNRQLYGHFLSPAPKSWSPAAAMQPTVR